MSLFGKILLILNLIGAAALSYLSVQLYSKRQAGAQVALAYDLQLKGLPTDAQQPDEQGNPLVERLPESVLAHLFSGVGGQPVKTQVEEVERLRGLVDQQLAEVKDKPLEGGFALAELLMPFGETNIDYDQYQAARAHLANKEAHDALLTRYKRARLLAVTILAEEEKFAKGRVRPVDEAFRLAFRAQPGLPSAWLTNTIARALPNTLEGLRGVDDGRMEALFGEALKLQLDEFEERKNQLFADALVKPEENRSSRDMQRNAVARLLFGLSGYPPLAKDGEEQARMVGRMLVVSGLPVGRGAITRRAEVIRSLELASDSAAAEERAVFLGDMNTLLESARDHSSLVREELRNVASAKADLELQQSNLGKKLGPTGDVAVAQKAYDDAAQKSQEALNELQRLSEELRRDRVAVRDMIDLMEAKEKQIQALEAQLRELETKKAR